ncbi:hypothetical protein ACIP6P_26635 [Streptomyces sp. NPDC088729]|uniref:hypothetical protein n=1 Tax=Streptomyces sp. NPDC088729 TaxID=3365876 RepID=UPI00381447A5
MTRTLAPHGTANRYSSRTDPCRCEACTHAASRAALDRKVAQQSGRSRRVPSGPVLAHLAKLAESVPIGQIALAAAAPRGSLSRLLVEQRPTISRALAEKILAVKVVDRSTMSMVSSIGAQRQLQALYTLGHWRKTIAEASGLTPQTISELLRGTWARITVECDDAVRRAYALLSMSLDDCERNLVRARREQWAPPLAWDEETIDVPTALPALDAVPPAPAGRDAATRFLLGESVVLDQAARREVIGYLMEWSPKSPKEIGAQLEMSGAAVSRQWERIKAGAREAGERVPCRRLALAGV